jgi:hypothetical protein
MPVATINLQVDQYTTYSQTFSRRLSRRLQ